MASISGLAPCPECGHLNLGEVCSECGFSFKRELIFWGSPPAPKLVIVRPTTPSPLGDQSPQTTTSYRQASPQASGTAEVKATVIADVPTHFQTFAIRYLKFRAQAFIADVGPYVRVAWNGGASSTWPGFPTHPGTRFGWTVGPDSAESPAINDDPTIGTGLGTNGVGGDVAAVGFVLERDQSWVGDSRPQFFVGTGQITLQPNGQPWSWASVNALTDVALRYSWSGASPAIDTADLDVAELWIEVHG